MHQEPRRGAVYVPEAAGGPSRTQTARIGPGETPEPPRFTGGASVAPCLGELRCPAPGDAYGHKVEAE
jgi:hypothetical protein